MRIYGFGLEGKMFFLVLLASIFTSYGVDTNKRLLEVDMKLHLLNKPPLKSIESEDGDIIDCVDIYKQPAFDHPALKNHILQMKPSYLPKTELTMMKKNESSVPKVSQKWQKSGNCPDGTIPIRRIKKEDLLRATSLESYGRKTPYIAWNSSKIAVLITQGYSYLGARGEINVWNPFVEAHDEYSTGQIWLLSGPRTSFESIECGWTVNPTVYGDKRTRFFTYWTIDGSVKTGCFDLICTGFVQTSQEITLGGTIEPISTEWGGQYDIPISIFMDTHTSNWWLRYDDKVVGYWPGSLFGLLRQKASVVQFGGEVYSKNLGKEGIPHTGTAMGNGNQPRLWGSPAYIHHIRIMDYSLTERYPEWVHEYMDEPYCYSSYNYVQYIKEPEFFFGGPGRSRWCP